MPIYEYACQSCTHRFETIQKTADSPLSDCPQCEQPALRKLVSAPVFRLKGAGWYETDFKTNGQRNVADNSGGKESDGDAAADGSKSGGEGTGKAGGASSEGGKQAGGGESAAGDKSQPSKPAPRKPAGDSAGAATPSTGSQPGRGA